MVWSTEATRLHGGFLLQRRQPSEMQCPTFFFALVVSWELDVHGQQSLSTAAHMHGLPNISGDAGRSRSPAFGRVWFFFVLRVGFTCVSCPWAAKYKHKCTGARQLAAMAEGFACARRRWRCPKSQKNSCSELASCALCNRGLPKHSTNADKQTCRRRRVSCSYGSYLAALPWSCSGSGYRRRRVSCSA